MAVEGLIRQATNVVKPETLVDNCVYQMKQLLVFGATLAIVSCYCGLRTHGGTQGVGRSTTQAVVASSILILIFDLFLTRLLERSGGKLPKNFVVTLPKITAPEQVAAMAWACDAFEQGLFRLRTGENPNAEQDAEQHAREIFRGALPRDLSFGLRRFD